MREANSGLRTPDLGSETKKSLRETLIPLKSLKTAKSGNLRAQRYQGVSKTRDFAGETISFHFRFVWALCEPEFRFCDGPYGRLGGLKNLEKGAMREKAFFRPLTY